MGLDVTAYSNCAPQKLSGNSEYPSDEAYEKGLAYIHACNPWRERMDGLESGAYSYDTKHSFSAGSYSGYNAWREYLAALIGRRPEELWYAENPEGPFAELISFSDCEGVIGPKTSAKLLVDFVEFDARAREFAAEKLRDGHPEWFVRVYDDFKKAFSLAADGGFVLFH